MKSLNKKLTGTLILIFTLILLSTIAYARPVTDIFAGGLLQINNFFEGGYAPYTKAIDFFFFSLLFISIYMMGVKYAFKEVKRPEQAIAILLGLMTAFLLVLGDFSVTLVLPYINWILYTLLFYLYWWLWKGIKNKFWHFVLALLSTLLTIGALQGMYDYLRAPEIPGVRAPGMPDVRGIGGGIGGFFRDLFGSFGGIKIPGVQAPGMPDWAKDMFEKPVAPPTGPEGLPQVTTPTPTAPKPTEEKGLSWGRLLLILAILASGVLAYKYRNEIKGMLKREGEELTTQQIIGDIGEVIIRKREKMAEIEGIEYNKTQIIHAGDKKIAIVRELGNIDQANLWEALTKLMEEEETPLKELLVKEHELVQKLQELKKIEHELYKSFNKWQEVIQKELGVNITQEIAELTGIITKITSLREIKQMGIIGLIALCSDFEKREETLRKEIEQLLEEENIEKLVKGKFETVKVDEKKLSTYNYYEIGLIKRLKWKVKEQINKLEELKGKISRQLLPSPPQPTKMEELSVKYIDAAGNQIILTKDEAENPDNTIPFGTELTIFTKLASGMDGGYRVLCRVDKTLVTGDGGKLKIIKVEKTPANQHPNIEWDLKDFELLEGKHVIAFYIANTTKSLYLLPREQRDLEWIILHIEPRTRIVITQPENNAKIPLGEEITLKAEIKNLTIRPEGYDYEWFIWDPITRVIEKIFPKVITTSNEVLGTLSTSEIGLGEHLIEFELMDVFPEATEESRKHLRAIPPIKINIIQPEEKLAEEGEPKMEGSELKRIMDELAKLFNKMPEFPKEE